MAGIQFIEYQGKKILEMDFQNLVYTDLNVIREIMEKSKQLIGAEPLNSVFTLTNVSNVRFCSEMIELFNDFTAHNKPYVKHGAVVGIVGPKKLAYNVVMKFSGRNVPIFPDRQAALEWLAQQN
jgi:aconitase B